MKQFLKIIFLSWLVLGLCAKVNADGSAEKTITKRPGVWAQDLTHRSADPDVLFGTLPNGLRYALRHNAMPTDGVSMRMRIGSGSLDETDDELGLAHFVEHMAFRGSAHIADGEVVRMLEHQGLSFGADTNAFTAHEQTVYKFDFPKADSSALDTGLTLFREIGERLTLDPKLIDVERGVVLSEERVRDNPTYKSQKADFNNLMEGTMVPYRWPIGTVESIKAATHERLEHYYRQHYRPDNATIVVVGNVDVKSVENEIIKRFSDWKNGEKQQERRTSTPQPAQPVVEYIEKGAPDEVELSWIKPVDQRAETFERDQDDVINDLALQVLNYRLEDMAHKPGSPFLAAAIGLSSDIFGVAGVLSLGISAEPSKLPEALNAAVEQLRQLSVSGVRPDEVQRAIKVAETGLEVGIAGAGTRKHAALADELIKDVNEGDLTLSPLQNKEILDRILKTVTVEQINRAIPELFAGKGPVLFRSAQKDPVGLDKLNEMLAQAFARPIASRKNESVIKWPYSQKGRIGKVSSQQEDHELQLTRVSFQNGVTLTVKHTEFDKGKVAVHVSFGHGRAGVDPQYFPSLWAVSMMTLGGTQKMSAGDIDRWSQTEGKVLGANLTVDVDAFGLNGATRPQDLQQQMELLLAYYQEPGYRPELSERLAATLPMIEGQLETSPGSVASRAIEKIIYGDEAARYNSVPTPEDLKQTSVAAIKSIVSQDMNGPIDITVVGDVELAKVIESVANTFGSLPKLTAHATVISPISMPARQSQPIVVRHQGREDQAEYTENWILPDHFTKPEISTVASVAQAVLEQRLVDTIREKMGMTYSPSASSVSSMRIHGLGYFYAGIETPEANFEKFHALLGEQLDQLAKTAVSQDELDRAKQPIIEGIIKSKENNAYWLGRLILLPKVPMMRDQMLHQQELTQAVSSLDVQAFFADYLAGKPAQVVIAKSAKLAH
jgi:zinc protease